MDGKTVRVEKTFPKCSLVIMLMIATDACFVAWVRRNLLNLFTCHLVRI